MTELQLQALRGTAREVLNTRSVDENQRDHLACGVTQLADELQSARRAVSEFQRSTQIHMEERDKLVVQLERLRRERDSYANSNFERQLDEARVALERATGPVPMRLTCPACGELHIDEGEFATKPHHTHACQECGCVWRPAVVATVGVRFLPGFKNGATP